MPDPLHPGPDLGARLNAARRRLDVSVRHLAQEMDLSVDNVRELLDGKRTPTPAIADHLIRLLGLEGEIVGELRTSAGRWTSSFSGEEVNLEAD
ncbi:MAG: helix-turn-helix transcriptional regulator [Acidimicrobiia bacterium]|nr:helix-turn-helix transcriptional regulator [Acidimicrobiia bacterium]